MQNDLRYNDTGIVWAGKVGHLMAILDGWRKNDRIAKENRRGPVLLSEWLGILWLSQNAEKVKRMPTA